MPLDEPAAWAVAELGIQLLVGIIFLLQLQQLARGNEGNQAGDTRDDEENIVELLGGAGDTVTSRGDFAQGVFTHFDHYPF